MAITGGISFAVKEDVVSGELERRALACRVLE
ncbi:hypothetical protein J2Z66_000306 [Paenibacillus eucommiae]|uniref:Uncharacterized protein n=1 Tax=Paenibacillus eucommiae TaxID=1355755 RepID=A0ABS4INU4_9BACL|nr:hypothetical protein [Paenibacillus eucommiae]